MSCRSAYRLLALFVFCLLPAQVQADDTQSIRFAYVQLDAAYSRRYVPAITALLAPGFKRVEWNAALTAAQYGAELKDSFDGTASVTAATQIQALTLQGDTAQATIARRLDLTLPQPLPHLPPPYFMVKVTQEAWRKVAGQWRMIEMTDTPLYETLCLLNERDQGTRRRLIADWKNPVLAQEMSQVDAADRVRLKQIIRQYGWPGFDLVGTDGEGYAFEIVQHADDDKPFQKQCLPLVDAAVKRGQSKPSDLAYLTDRILCGDHKLQIYGTQLIQDTHGNYVPLPLADPIHVDERRAAAGLCPLTVYQAQLKQAYQPKRKP